jgi:hypothetical protein
VRADQGVVEGVVVREEDYGVGRREQVGGHLDPLETFQAGGAWVGVVQDVGGRRPGPRRPCR